MDDGKTPDIAAPFHPPFAIFHFRCSQRNTMKQIFILALVLAASAAVAAQQPAPGRALPVSIARQKSARPASILA